MLAQLLVAYCRVADIYMYIYNHTNKTPQIIGLSEWQVLSYIITQTKQHKLLTFVNGASLISWTSQNSHQKVPIY